MFREIVQYGLNSFLANSSGLLLNQSGPVLIGHFLPSSFVGFYGLPARLLQYAVKYAVSRIGIVTRSSAADLGARGRSDDILQLGIYANRYSFTLFMPMALALVIYGRDIIRLWVGNEFATFSAPLIPIFLIANGFVAAGQFNSSAILFGISKHGGYARGLLVEGILNVIGLCIFIPRYGILGAACVSAVLMVAVRQRVYPRGCCAAAWTTACGDIWYPSTCARCLTAVPVVAFAWLLKTSLIPGRSWPELFGACVLVALFYSGLSFFTCFAHPPEIAAGEDPDHRDTAAQCADPGIRQAAGVTSPRR